MWRKLRAGLALASVVGLGSACAGGEASLASEGGPGSVVCSSIYGKGGGGQLVDPARACLNSFSSCSDGKLYQLSCDGMGCTCMVDGVFDELLEDMHSFITPRCPDINEAAVRCDWPIGLPPGVGYGSGAVQGMPCSEGFDDGSDCECVDDLWQCPGLGGCSVIGSHVPAGADLPVIHFLPDGTFYVAEVTEQASFEELVEGKATGFYGSWTLDGDVLSMRSYNPGGDQACLDQPGRYAVSFNDACELTELRLLDDPCKPRRVLETTLAPAQD